MLTLFSVPKPFRDHITIIQRNAIHSWTLLQPRPEIILFGSEEGTADVAREFGVRHIPQVARNEYGTPLLDSVFDQVGRIARNRLVCYVNADIILLSDFIEAVRHVRFRTFLMVGQRWDVDLIEPWDFDQLNWEGQLHRYVVAYGVLHPRTGCDYFVFPWNSGIGSLPPFAVGRPGWDNWVIYYARSLRIPVVDATPIATVVHQNHDYSHVPDRTGEDWEGPEADYNQDLLAARNHVFTLEDANWILTSQGPRRPKWTRERLRRFMLTLPILHSSLRLVISPLKALCQRVPKAFARKHEP